MKITKDLKKLTTTQRELARAIGITQPYVSQLTKNGVVVRDENDKNGGVFVVESLKNYFTQRGEGGTAEDAGGDVDINIERAKREKAERQIAELKLAKMEHRVYDARAVELVQTEMISNLRTQLLGLPSKLAPILEGHDKGEIYETLTHEIEEKLGELAAYTPEQYTEEEISDGTEE